MSDQEVPITIDLMKSFRIAKVFDSHHGRINHLNFSLDGDLLISSSDDDSISIYDAVNATVKKTLFFRKTGVQLAQFSHHMTAILCAANKGSSGDIMYHSTLDNRFLRIFQGHTDRVNSLTLCPQDDHFLSAAADGTVRLWDLRSKQCEGMLLATGRPCVAYDPAGLIFAVTSDSGTVRLFDPRSYQKGPFESFALRADKAEWTKLEFSPDGHRLMMTAASNLVVILDAFRGVELQSFTEHVNAHGLELDSAFCPSGQFVASASEEGHIFVWDSISGEQSIVLKGGHCRPVSSVRWSPTRMMLATACSHLAFWIPETR